MKKALIVIIVLLGLTATAGIIYLSSLEGDYTVSRSIEINMPPSHVSNIVADFHTWPTWSPWLCLEQDATVKIKGKGTQVGDIFEWRGKMIGSGELEHMQIEAAKYIGQEIRFNEPFNTKSKISFVFAPTSNGVSVTWEMKGKMPFLFRFLTEKMKPLIAMDYERGLKMLKEYAEIGKVSAKIKIKGVEDFEGLEFVGKSGLCNKEAIAAHMKETLYDVGNWLVVNTTFPQEAVTVYKQFTHTSDTCEYICGFKLSQPYKPFAFAGAKTDSIPSGKIVKVMFYGDYQHLGNAWTAAYMYMQQHSLKADPAKYPFEIYLNDPAFFPDTNDWVTEVCIPIL